MYMWFLQDSAMARHGIQKYLKKEWMGNVCPSPFFCAEYTFLTPY